jgi:putative FmdB family regulatory protein
MPVYDYLCTACDHRADILHGINDPGPNFCPSCGSEGTMRKQFAAPAIHFKGSGWAKKDRAATSSPGRSPSTKSGAPAASDSGTKSPSDPGTGAAATPTSPSTGPSPAGAAAD